LGKLSFQPIIFSMRKPGFVPLFRLLVLFVSSPLFAVPPLSIGAIRENVGADSGEAVRRARLALIAEAEKYRGAPYRYGGVDGKGFDCSGLVYRSFQDAFSVSVPRNTAALYNWAEKIEARALQPGDLVFFSTLPSDKRRVSHAGIYAGEGRFIHAASEGPVTGVIYSRLDEDYWRRTFAAAGRALPEASPGVRRPELASLSQPEPPPLAAVPGKLPPVSGKSPLPEEGPAARLPESGGTGDPVGEGGSWRDKVLLGAGFAPTWNGVLSGGNIIRGGASQLGIAWKGELLGRPLMPGFELRPEWDNTLGVFRIPITFSLGLDERFRIFAGPAFSSGGAELRTKEGERRYTGGTAIIGAAGITFAPFPINTGKGTLSIYGEAAWQSYFPESGTARNLNADFSAAFRLSTGIRYMWGL
jgi:probable lipoprotein NlpC